jgi:prophage antirepressor-like protein
MDMQPDINDLFPEEKTKNDVVPFFFEGKRVRTVIIDGELHFLASTFASGLDTATHPRQCPTTAVG